MGVIGGLLSTGIGLAMEAKAARRSPSQTGELHREPSTGSQSISENVLDAPISYGYSDRNEPQPQGPASSYYNDNARHGQSFSGRTPSPQQAITPRRLQDPVIIPQRRPENKSRGWVMAYAPSLAACDIDQATFLDFVHSFNHASKSSPYLDVINIAAFAVGFVPTVSTFVVSMVVPIAVMYAKRAQTAHQTKSFLDKVNIDLFEPRGLFAMVMTFKPDQQSRVLPVDTSSPKAMVMRTLSNQINGSSNRNKANTTYGELQLPPAAPLIFPSIDDLPESGAKNNMQKTGQFIGDFMDRRARAKYNHQNPDSALTVDAPRFASRFGDPNHPANNGGLIGLVTGGAVSKRSMRQGIINSDSSDEERRSRRRNQNSIAQDQQSLIKGLKGKVMKSDVLYLMIVNKPTEAEMAAANEMLSNPSMQRSPSSNYTPQASQSTRNEWGDEQYSSNPPPSAYQNPSVEFGRNQIPEIGSAHEMEQPPPAYETQYETPRNPSPRKEKEGY